MRRFILAATAIAALAVPALAPALASADVQRYQTQTATFTVTQPAGQAGDWSKLWHHTYNVKFNPCDGTFTGIGHLWGDDQTFTDTETINGSYANGKVSFTATRDSDQFSWTLANAPTDGTTVTDATTNNPNVWWKVEAKITQPQFTNVSTFKNHGQYVSSNGGGDDVAHACIGMPINSNN